ncbi:unnamed protein product [Camellia sinensis]
MLCTIPLDTAKVRLQHQKNAVTGMDWVKKFYVGDNFVGDDPLSKKILAALTTGAIAITVANPTDLVKVRLQAEGKLPPGEGLGALWTGLGPNRARNAIINAAELASYDQVKQTLLKIPGFTDNVFTHMLSGLGAGFFAVCIGSPVDVQSHALVTESRGRDREREGPLAFYKGFIPNFGRLGSWNVIMFLILEQLKNLWAKMFVRSIESA